MEQCYGDPYNVSSMSVQRDEVGAAVDLRRVVAAAAPGVSIDESAE